MSAELAILNKAKKDSGNTVVIYKNDFDSNTMVDISDKFFGGEVETTPNDISDSTAVLDSLTDATNTIDCGFSSDGLNFYVSDNTSHTITQYVLTIPWDISTRTFSLETAVLNTVASFEFSNDGLFLIGGTFGAVLYKYELTSAYDLSTINTTAIQTVNLPTLLSSIFYGFRFNNDGTKLFQCTFNDNSIIEYNLSTAYDLTSLNAGAEYFLTTNTQGIMFNNSGERCYLTTSVGTIHQWILSTAFDLSTATYNTVVFYGQSTRKFGFTVSGDGLYFYVAAFDLNSIEVGTLNSGTLNSFISSPPLVINPNDSYKIVVMK